MHKSFDIMYFAFHKRFDPVRIARCVAVLVVCSLATACGGGESSQGGPPPPVPVALLTLQHEPVERIGEFVSTIKSRRSMMIQPQAEGFITRILVASGTRVRPGTPLFEIDSTAQRAVVASLEAQRAAREADATFARQQVERAKALFDVGAMSRQEHEQAVAQQQTAEAQVRSVQAQIRQQEAELAYYRVIAPTSGVIGDVPVHAGERVARSTVLTTVDENVGLEAYINVPVQQASRLAMDLPVRLVDDGGDLLASSHVSFIAASVDDATQTVLVKAPIDADTSGLRADQFVRALIVWATESALSLPVVATQRINGRYFAFVAENVDGGLVARQRPITVGPINGDSYVVLDGLGAGDRLIVAGTQKIGDGVPVQSLPSSAAQGGE